MAIPQTPQPLQLRLRNRRQQRIICKLRDIVFARAAASSCYVGPNNVTAVVERRIRQLIPSFHTPAHPTYALMIQKAMEELSEGGRRVSEADISEFIERECEDLPWAHEGMLRLHLEKQCEIGVLLMDGEKYNLNLVKECGDEIGPGRKRRPRKGKRGMTGKKKKKRS